MGQDKQKEATPSRIQPSPDNAGWAHQNISNPNTTAINKTKQIKTKQRGKRRDRVLNPGEMEMDKMTDHMASPSNSQKTVSDDDEIDYSVKPEFYDSDIDYKDELWVQKKRKGGTSDAVLSCPSCFTTLCLDCQRHEKYVTQYRAIFVENCKIGSDQIVHQKEARPRRGKRGRESSEHEATPAGNQTVKQVCCLVCSTEVGVIDADEVYHFFNVLPSES